MTNTTKQILPALQNSSKLQDPDLSDIGSRNYTATILKYANLAVTLPQLETEAKQVVPAINEVKNSIPDVAVTQIQTTGTKIATIAIDSTSTDLYAPTSTLSGLSDVTLTTPSTNQVLTYNGSAWVNATSALPWIDLTGTLTAGSTSITISDSCITTNSTIEVFDDLDVPYNSKSLSTGSITLTFDAQESNMSIKVRVS